MKIFHLLICIFLSHFIYSKTFGKPLFEVVEVEGERVNLLVGYGLVVGLQGTGDQTRQTRFTSQSIISMLRQFGIQLPFGVDPKLKNVAAVSVHAQLPTFMREGQKIDVVVSSIGDAKSLQGGSLLATPLKGLDGEYYAVAQGNLVIGLGGANSLELNTVGRIPSGALVEKAVLPESENTNIVLNLKKHNFSTVNQIITQIQQIFGDHVVTANDASQIVVKAPTDKNERIGFMSILENINIDEPVLNNKVIINARTGTVVMGDKITIKPVAVSHGNLVVTIDNSFTPSLQDENDQQKSNVFVLPNATMLQDIVAVLSAIGASPPDLASILQAIKKAGALDAELEVI